MLKRTVASTRARRSLEEAILPLGYHESVPLEGHVVLLCTALKDLVHFIAPLRQPTVPCAPIVILTNLHDRGFRMAFLEPNPHFPKLGTEYTWVRNRSCD